MPRAQDVEFIMVHCLATDNDFMANRPVADVIAAVRDWHVRERKWRDIAYAMVIHRDGERGKGRDLDGDGDVWEEIGAGAKGWNSNCIHVALNGGKTSSATDEFSDNFTPEQDAALRHTIAEIRAWVGRDVPLKGHNEVANKACPGFDVNRWYRQQPPRTIAQSTTMQATGAGAAATIGAGGTAISQLDGNAQLLVVALVGLALLAFVWIARERIKQWARGRH